jgi:hypothetical protein
MLNVNLSDFVSLSDKFVLKVGNFLMNSLFLYTKHFLESFFKYFFR